MTTRAQGDVSIIKILQYIRSTFSEEAVLDSIPLGAAANPGAYHAWRTYRAGALETPRSLSPNPVDEETQTGSAEKTGGLSTLGRNRRPGEWNWEGVWEDRVKKAIKASLSESVLYGGASSAEDIIRFRDTDNDGLAKMKEKWLATLPSTSDVQ